MAVTHSRGKGVAQQTPGSNPELEKSLWQQKQNYRASKKGGEKCPDSSSKKDDRVHNEDEERRRGSEIGPKEMALLGDKGAELDFHIKAGSTGYETFHSMAEIASCSYEARKVIFS